MSQGIPDDIMQRIQEFTLLHKTGQITLNVYEGGVVSAEIREHVKALPRKIVLDNGPAPSIR